MAVQQGLFTQGPSVDDILAKRNQRSADMQQQLMNQAAQGARDPAKMRAVSLLGSSLGRALAGSMDGGSTREKLEAEQAKKREAQNGYLDAEASEKSKTMFDQVKLLQSGNHMAAAAKMLQLAKAAKKEEEATAAAVAKATADAAEATRVQGLAAEKVKADEAKETNKAAALVEAERLKATALLSKEDRDELAKKKTILTADALSDKYGAEFPEGSLWEQDGNGDLTLLNPQNKSINNFNMPVGFKVDSWDSNGMPETMSAVTGSPQALAIAEAELEAVNRKLQGDNAEVSKEVHRSVVMESLGDLKNLLTMEKDGKTTFVSGGGGWLMAQLPISSQRHNAEAALAEIQSNIGFGELQLMRDNSPTGGALGQVTELEIKLLQAMIGRLDLLQTPENLFSKIADIERRYAKLTTKITQGYTVNADGTETPYGYPAKASQAAAAAPSTQGEATDAELSSNAMKYITN